MAQVRRRGARGLAGVDAEVQGLLTVARDPSLVARKSTHAGVQRPAPKTPEGGKRGDFHKAGGKDWTNGPVGVY